VGVAWAPSSKSPERTAQRDDRAVVWQGIHAIRGDGRNAVHRKQNTAKSACFIKSRPPTLSASPQTLTEFPDFKISKGLFYRSNAVIFPSVTSSCPSGM
jgi:hypothetical protein